MRSERKAELQRKLSMGAVPRPPAGLAERIKSDIPNYLQAEPERERFSRSVAFSLRIAASILLLITSVFVALNLLEPDGRRSALPSAGVPLVPAMTRVQTTTSDTRAPAAPAEEIRLEMTEEIPAAKKIAPPQAAPVGRLADTANEPRDRGEASRDDQELGGPRQSIALMKPGMMKPEVPAPAQAPPPPAVVAASAKDGAPPIAQPEPVVVVAEAPAIEAYASAPAAPAQPKLANNEERRNTRATSISLVPGAYADALDLGASKSVFGISVDPGAFQRIKTTLEHGGRPAQGTVNVEALVNYFAGAPTYPPRSGVRLEVEASPLPVATKGDHAVLRFTIDTPALDMEPGESIPPVARDAHVEVDFSGGAVSAFHRIGTAEPITAEPALLHNASVTALYDLELRPHLKSSQRVVTVRLLYRSVTDGREHKIERIIHGHDLAGDWTRATRRHRLASLGAVWGESLEGSWRSDDVARRAEELVSQNPKDPLARELAHAASASGGER
jgi:hypothetical protein